MIITRLFGYMPTNVGTDSRNHLFDCSFDPECFYYDILNFIGVTLFYAYILYNLNDFI